MYMEVIVVGEPGGVVGDHVVIGSLGTVVEVGEGVVSVRTDEVDVGVFTVVVVGCVVE